MRVGRGLRPTRGLDTFLGTAGALRDFTQDRLIGYCYEKTFDVG